MSGCITTAILLPLCSELAGSENGRFIMSNENEKMMKEGKKNRNRWLHLRLSEEEFKILQKYFEESLCPKLSDFARLNLLKKPVVLKYRNTSFDDSMAELIKLRAELNSIGNNFNQAVKKLHSQSQISEFKVWILSFETDKKMLFNSIGEIEIIIRNLAEKWLQS